MELFSRKEVAEILKVKHHTIWFYEKRGIIKPVGYVSGRPRYSLESIQDIPTEMIKKISEST